MADFLGRFRRRWTADPTRSGDRTAEGPQDTGPVRTPQPAPTQLPDAAEQLTTLTAMGLAFEPWATPERMVRDLIRNIDDSPSSGHPRPGGRHRRGVYWWPLEVYPRLVPSSTQWRTTLFAPSRKQRGLRSSTGPLEAWDAYLTAQALSFPRAVRPRELIVLDYSGTDSGGRLDLLVDGEPCAIAVRDFSTTSALDAAQSLLSLAIQRGKSVVAPEPPGMVGNARTCYLISSDRAEEFRTLWTRYLEPLRRDAHRHATNRPPVHSDALETPGLPPEGTRPPVLELPVPEVSLAGQLATLRRLGLETAPGVGEEELAEALERRTRPCADGSPDPGVGPYLGLLRLRGQQPPLVSLTRDPDERDGPGWAEWEQLQERFLIPLKTSEKEFLDQVQWFRTHDFEQQLARDEQLDVRGHLMVLERMGFPLGDLRGRGEEQLRELVEDSLSPDERPTVWRGLFAAVDFHTWTPVLGHVFHVPDSPLDYFGVWEKIVGDIAAAAGTTGLVDAVSTSGDGEDGGDGVLHVEYAGRVHEFRPEYLGKYLDLHVVAELCELLRPPGHTAVDTGDYQVWVRDDCVGEFRRRILPALA